MVCCIIDEARGSMDAMEDMDALRGRVDYGTTNDVEGDKRVGKDVYGSRKRVVSCEFRLGYARQRSAMRGMQWGSATGREEDHV